MEWISSRAEELALEALTLPAFQHINLKGIKSDVAEILALFGRESIFSEYTKHDISHINAMADSLTWLIPERTKNVMTPTDWLILVLAIYIHDLGLVVTKAEFEMRLGTDFVAYKADVETGRRGKDYQAKISKMPAGEAETFLYQEFVRDNHAQRIRAWISNAAYRHLGVADAIASQIQTTFSKLDDRILRDLGIVCESHHLDDLDDLTKYKVRNVYGNSADEMCNLQYIAIMLRTADLLHITKDRAPSIAFRIINPSDPKSIQEWAKQVPMVAVRPVPSKDTDGNVDLTIQPSLIGFTAYFTEPEGFFALTSYLLYARNQLRKSADWAERTRKKEALDYSFPWIGIDESNLEAEGFLKKEFEFSLDQGKILDLLTGHTLYNDASIVIRELVQNSIDAVRLEAFERRSPVTGSISIIWCPENRMLTIEDNGTGMTQEIIQKHFLRAGSSRYQDLEFVKAYPEFSPISRFGIGVLSAFMISDEVEVFTVSTNQTEKARKLTLRKLHGKYLIREYDRNSTEIPMGIKDHGTHISLKVRVDAEPPSVLDTARRWVLFPPCKITVIEGADSPITIGFESPRDAMVHYLQERGVSIDSSRADEPRINVVQFARDGLEMAIAVRWDKYFREWSLMTTTDISSDAGESHDARTAIGTCVEGMRVDDHTPGFDGPCLLAIANATGKNSPKTNVARSGFESTLEQKKMTGAVYDIYCEQIMDEIKEIYSSRGFSPTWAAGEANILISPLLGGAPHYTQPLDEDLMWQSIASIPCLLLEDNGTRTVISINELSMHPIIWTVDSSGIRSIEELLREIPAAISISDIASVVREEQITLPQEPVCGFRAGSPLSDMALKHREVDVIKVSEVGRRIDLRWKMQGDDPLWINLRGLSSLTRRQLGFRVSQDFMHSTSGAQILLAAESGLTISGLLNEIAVKSVDRIFVLPNHKITGILRKIVVDAEQSKRNLDVLWAVNLLIDELLKGRSRVKDPTEYVRRQLSGSRIAGGPAGIYREVLANEEFVDAIGSTAWNVFDSGAWLRKAATGVDMDGDLFD